jgi:HEAT repeat protein
MEKRKTENRTGIRSMIRRLASDDARVRKEARLSLISKGRQAVEPLNNALRRSKVYTVRWEAAKALDTIHDTRAIPALVRALNDTRTEVRWLAAEALMHFHQAAWPDMMRVLIRKGSDTTRVRHGVHHVIREQHDRELEPQLKALRRALESEILPESVPIAAYNLLVRMRKHQQQAILEEHRLAG